MKILTQVLSKKLTLTAVFFAVLSAPVIADNIADLEKDLGIEKIFKGTFEHRVNSKGLFCQKYFNMDFDWQITMTDVDIDITENDNLKIKMIFSPLDVDVDMARKGGVFCSVTNAYTDMRVKDINLSFFLEPQVNTDRFKVKLDSLTLGHLDISKIEVENFFGMSGGGDLPSSIDNFLRKSANWVVLKALSSSLKELIDDEISRRARDILDSRKKRDKLLEGAKS